MKKTVFAFALALMFGTLTGCDDGTKRTEAEQKAWQELTGGTEALRNAKPTASPLWRDSSGAAGETAPDQKYTSKPDPF